MDWFVLMQSLQAKRDMVRCASSPYHKKFFTLWIIFRMFLQNEMHAAADPATNPASAITLELLGEITVETRATGLLQDPDGSNRSAHL